MPWYSVGAPGSTVTRSLSTVASTRSTSKTASGIMVAPALTAARMPAFNPNMWKYGLTIRYRSSASSSVMATQSAATRVVPPWVWTTPLGVPVVPEVNRMSQGSSGVTAAERRATSASPAPVPRALKSCQDAVPSTAGPRATTTVSRSQRSVPVPASMAT